MNLYLPPRDLLSKTNSEDPLDYYYHPLTGWMYCQRLVMALDELGNGSINSLLEVGYGSGILLPELARRSQKLCAIDLHNQVAAVEKMLDAEHIHAELKIGSVLEMDYLAATFDAIVCLSVMEHMDEITLPLALKELRRVSTPGAVVVLGFPVRNTLTDFFYRLVGFSPRDLHPSSHRDIIQAAQSEFASVQVRAWPMRLPLDLTLYVVCQCRV